MQQSNTSSQQHEERNRLVLSLLDYVTPLLRKSAGQFHLDYEDLRQDAACTIIRMLDSNEVDFSRNTAYLFVRYRIYSRILNTFQYVLRRRSASLDAPISDDEDSTTLADLLPSSYEVEPLAVLVAQERIQELAPMLAQPNPSRRRAIRERFDTALALCEVVQ